MNERGNERERERNTTTDRSFPSAFSLHSFSLVHTHTLLLTFSFPRKPFSSPSLSPFHLSLSPFLLSLSPHVSHRWSVSLTYRYAFFPFLLSSSGIMREMHLDSLLVVLELADCSPYKVRAGVLSNCPIYPLKWKDLSRCTIRLFSISTSRSLPSLSLGLFPIFSSRYATGKQQKSVSLFFTSNFFFYCLEERD